MLELVDPRWLRRKKDAIPFLQPPSMCRLSGLSPAPSAGIPEPNKEEKGSCTPRSIALNGTFCASSGEPTAVANAFPENTNIYRKYIYKEEIGATPGKGAEHGGRRKLV